VLLHAVGVLGFPVTLKLERSFPTNHGVELKQHTKRDGLRHRRILHKYSYPNVVVGFGVLGTYDPFDVGDVQQLLFHKHKIWDKNSRGYFGKNCHILSSLYLFRILFVNNRIALGFFHD
jgi:hypothetical protein